MQHDHGLLRPQTTSWTPANHWKKFHGGQPPPPNPYTLIAMGHFATGSTKPRTKNTSANLSNAFYTPPHRYQNAQQPGGLSHHGKHAVPPAMTHLPPIPTTRKTTKTTAMTNQTMNITLLPHHRDKHHPRVNLCKTPPLPPSNTNPKDG